MKEIFTEINKATESGKTTFQVRFSTDERELYEAALAAARRILDGEGGADRMKDSIEYIKQKRAALGAPCAYCGEALESLDEFTSHVQDGVTVWVHYRCHNKFHRFERIEDINRRQHAARKIAYICSPYRGDAAEILKHLEYARELVKRELAADRVPICPHLYLTQVLDDRKADERARGLLAGLELLRACDVLIVGNRYGISEGMAAEIERAHELGIPVYYTNMLSPNEML